MVNKEFYKGVSDHFEKLIQGDLKTPSSDREDVTKFAIRLIGRIMFCWFLKQKKSEKGQLIPDEIISLEAVKSNKKDYYHEVLEPLFFEVLNTQIGSRDVSDTHYDKVPYLNGSLFTAQENDYYSIDKKTFISKYHDSLSVSDSWFLSFFELLETYNFTIDENTVFDQELSVDPEMLGHIFENLLADIGNGAKSNERKKTGSYYTPRQIVEYMVDQSLTEHLKKETGMESEKVAALVSYDLNDDLEYPLTDEEKDSVVEAIDTVKILDPACGSGAFPMGVLQKIVWILQRVDPQCKRWQELKMRDMQSRLFKQKIINEFKANLEYTRKLEVIKNSIFGVDIQTIAVEISRLRCFLTLVVEAKIDENNPNRGIEPLPNLDFKFLSANTLIGLENRGSNGLFNSGTEKLSKIMAQYFSCNQRDRESIRIDFICEQKDIITDPTKKHAHLADQLTAWSPFKNETSSWFDPEWMFGVTGKFDIIIGNPPYAQVDRKDFDELEYPYTQGKDKGKQNLYKLFIEKSKNLTKKEGFVCLITQSSLMADITAEGTREMLLKETNILYVIEFPKKSEERAGQVFDSVLQGTCIVLIRNIKQDDSTMLLSAGNTKDTIAKLDFEKIKQKEILNIYPNGKYFPLVKNGDLSILKSIMKNKVHFESMIKETSQGDFNLTTARKEFSAEKTTVKMYRGKNIHRFWIDNEVKEYIREGFLPNNVEMNEKHKFFLYQRVTGTMDRYRLHFSFSNIGERWLCGNTVNKFLLSDEKNNIWILGVLNSKMMDWFFRKTSTNNGVYIYEVERFPIPKKPDQKIIKKIEELVNEIIKKKKENNQADTLEKEKEIDELVMNLYNLTEKEKQTIRTA